MFTRQAPVHDPLVRTLLLNAAVGGLAAVSGVTALVYSDAWGFGDLLMAGSDSAVVLSAIALQSAALLGGGMAATSVFLIGED